jgi:esterase/lipase superfamily enzyme
MDLLVLGHAGARVLVFPTSLGTAFEWEDRRMHYALGEHLERGWLQFYCVDSYNAESWYAKWMHPSDRARAQDAYERHLLDEVLPLSQHRNPNPFLITTGASFGAYHAVDFAFRYPHLVGRVIGMSGLYDITEQTDGYYDEHVYRHNPSHYVADLGDHGHLEAMRRMDIILVTGQDDPFVGNNKYLSGLLWSKGVGNALRLWDGWAHDWPWWQEMIRLYISGHD